MRLAAMPNIARWASIDIADTEFMTRRAFRLPGLAPRQRTRAQVGAIPLSVRFEATDSVTLDIDKNEPRVVIGPNGAGKTTPHEPTRNK